MHSGNQEIFLISSVLWLLTGFVSFAKNRESLLLTSLFFAGVSIFSLAASLDLFLNVWDERFHALVAKNMINNPFKPVLYADPILERDYSRWDRAHVWLHKQPLFMWQMAASMKIFGISTFAMRLPSIILSSVLVLAFYRSGKLLLNRLTGFIAAILAISSFYWFGLVSGRVQLDQNDVVFISYIGLSVWAFIEFQFSRKTRWAIAVGAFIGFAILCKWLAGTFVFAIWILYILIEKHHKLQLLNFTKALFTSAIIALPWQIYSLVKYPINFKTEQAYNALHLWESVEGHSGDYLFYVNLISTHYNVATSLLLLIALIVFTIHRFSKLKLALTIGFIAQFVFFSFAATKMSSFSLAGWFIGILALAYLLGIVLTSILKLIPSQFHGMSLFVAITLIVVSRLNIAEYKDTFFADTPNYYVSSKLHNMNLFQAIDLPENYVLFNVKGRHYVEAMFWNNNTVYEGLPTEKEIEELELKDRKTAVLRGLNSLPDYITKNPFVKIIEGFNYVCE